MSVEVKICGLRDAASVAAALDADADYVGFVFYPGSKDRCIDAKTAATLVKKVPADIVSVGLFVNPTDEDIKIVLDVAPLGMLQLHGGESPQRVVDIRKKFKLPVMKAIGIASGDDVKRARLYEEVADLLLLDAQPVSDASRGGNGVAFDWSLLRGVEFERPWMLAGGLNAANIEKAVQVTGAEILDVSSGVEDAPGQKNPAKIKAFMDAAYKIDPY